MSFFVISFESVIVFFSVLFCYNASYNPLNFISENPLDLLTAFNPLMFYENIAKVEESLIFGALSVIGGVSVYKIHQINTLEQDFYAKAKLYQSRLVNHMEDFILNLEGPSSGQLGRTIKDLSSGQIQNNFKSYYLDIGERKTMNFEIVEETYLRSDLIQYVDELVGRYQLVYSSEEFLTQQVLKFSKEHLLKYYPDDKSEHLDEEVFRAMKARFLEVYGDIISERVYNVKVVAFESFLRSNSFEPWGPRFLTIDGLYNELQEQVKKVKNEITPRMKHDFMFTKPKVLKG